MNEKQATTLALAAAALGGASTADATVYPAALTQVSAYSNAGAANLNLAASTATWSYDDVTNLMTQTGGTFEARLTTSPTTTFFRYTATGMVLGNGAAASASTYVCQEGNFGAAVGASICGNYNFGANFTNESTTSWGPGTATSKALGGDDVNVGPIQSIGAFDGMNVISWVGTTLQLSNRACTGQCTTLPAGTYNTGYLMTFSAGPVVPVPAAAWLFGSALGLMGLARRTRAS